MPEVVERRDVVVIGGGVMGSAAAWQIATRCRDVLLLERSDGIGPRGASFGGRRNINLGYWDDTYLAMLARALPLWASIEDESRARVFDRSGIVVHGESLPVDEAALKLRRHGFVVEDEEAAVAARRWPGFAFAGRALFLPQAGSVDADRAVAAFQNAARRRGAELRHSARVLRIRVIGDDRVRLIVSEGADDERVIEARQVVVAAGAWAAKLIGRLVSMPTLFVTHQQPLRFRTRMTTPLPSVNFHPRQVDPTPGFFKPGFYGIPNDGTVTVGWHTHGRTRDPDATLPRRPDGALHRRIQLHVRAHLPGLDPDDYEVAADLLSTATGNWNFIVDRSGPLVVGAGFGGHGFKFAPAIGSMLADLVDGRHAPDLFSLSLHRRARAGRQ